MTVNLQNRWQYQTPARAHACSRHRIHCIYLLFLEFGGGLYLPFSSRTFRPTRARPVIRYFPKPPIGPGSASRMTLSVLWLKCVYICTKIVNILHRVWYRRKHCRFNCMYFAADFRVRSVPLVSCRRCCHCNLLSCQITSSLCFLIQGRTCAHIGANRYIIIFSSAGGYKHCHGEDW